MNGPTYNLMKSLPDASCAMPVTPCRASYSPLLPCLHDDHANQLQQAYIHNHGPPHEDHCLVPGNTNWQHILHTCEIATASYKIGQLPLTNIKTETLHE